MKPKLILAFLAFLAIAGTSLLMIPGLLGGRGAAEVSWTPEDEVTVVVDPEADAETVGAGNDLARTAVDAPKSEAPAADAESRRPMIGVHGRVIDAGRAPVAGAQVLLQLNAGLRGGPFAGGRGGRGGDRQQINKPVVTGADGTFVFRGRGFENPTISLVVTHATHAPTVFEKDFTSKGGDLDVGDVTLTPGGSVLGAVTDIDGNAVPGTTATLQPSGGNRLGWLRNRDEVLPKIVVDASGTFRVTHLMAGEYRIEATAPRKISASTESFTVVEGQEERLDPLRLGPGHELRGLVLSLAGTPVAGADVELNAMGRGRGFQTETDKKGEFVIDHVPAEPTMALRVQAKGFVTYNLPSVKPAESAALVVRLQDGLKITGVVRDQANNEPVKRFAARVRRVGGIASAQAAPGANFDPAQMREQFRRMRDGTMPEAEAAALRSQMEEMQRNFGGGGRGNGGGGRRGGNGGDNQDNGGGRRGGPGGMRGGGDPNSNMPADPGEVLPRPEGTFSFTGLDEGTYVVDIGSPEHQRIRSERVTVQSGQAAPNLTIFVQAGIDVSGKVISSSDRAAIAGARVELVQVTQNAQPTPNPEAGSQPGGRGRGGFMRQMFGGGNVLGFPIAEARSDKDGAFSFKHVGAGRYQLVARADGHSRRVGDPFDLAQTTGGVVVELGALATIQGKVRGIPRGKEESATVVVFAGMQNTKTERVSAEGTYRIEGLEPGEYVVRAFLGDMRTFLRLEMQTRGFSQDAFKPDVTLGDGERKDLDLAVTLHPLGQIAGNVQKNGLPARGLRVSLTSAEPAANATPQDANAGGGRGGRGGRGGQGGGPGGGRGGFFGGIAPVVTDSRGEFLFTEVPEGRYLVRIQQNGQNQDLWKQEVTVRSEDTQRVTASLQTGGLSGRVKAEEADAGDLSGNVMLYAGVKAVPQDQGEFQRNSTMYRIPLRGGTFSLNDIPSGEYLLVLQPRNREPVQQNIFVPLGDTLSLDLKAGAKRATTPGTGGNGARGGQGATPAGQRGQNR